METRNITQIRIFKLMLNDMRSERIEYTEIAAVSYEYVKMLEWYNIQKNENCIWKDDIWHKTFKQNSLLEWFNPTDNFELQTIGCGYGKTGIFDEWIDEDRWNEIKHKFFIIE